MTRRAFHGPMNWKQNVLLTIAMGSAAVLLGCGGGGGGGNGGGGGTLGDCGSAAGAGTVICGFVTSSSTTTGVNGATVLLHNVAGTTLASAATQTDPSSGKPGFYKITVPGGVALPTSISVTVPSTGYHSGFVGYVGKVYIANFKAADGGPCYPAVTPTAGADTRLLNPLVIYSDSVPPPVAFNCPR